MNGYIEHPMSAAWGPKEVRRNKGGISRANVAVIHEGMVIGGWENVLAVERKKGRKVRMVGLGPVDPVKYVIDRYAHLIKDPVKRAIAIAKCSDWLSPGRPLKRQIQDLRQGNLQVMTSEAIADYANVSVRSVVRAKNKLRRQAEEEDWRLDLHKAVAKAEELERQLVGLQVELQDYADRALPERDMSEALRATNSSNRTLKVKLRTIERSLKISQRNGKLKDQVIKRLKAHVPDE